MCIGGLNCCLEDSEVPAEDTQSGILFHRRTALRVEGRRAGRVRPGERQEKPVGLSSGETVVCYQCDMMSTRPLVILYIKADLLTVLLMWRVCSCSLFTSSGIVIEIMVDSPRGTTLDGIGGVDQVLPYSNTGRSRAL